LSVNDASVSSKAFHAAIFAVGFAPFAFVAGWPDPPT
jgi:hypothetical protein